MNKDHSYPAIELDEREMHEVRRSILRRLVHRLGWPTRRAREVARVTNTNQTTGRVDPPGQEKGASEVIEQTSCTELAAGGAACSYDSRCSAGQLQERFFAARARQEAAWLRFKEANTAWCMAGAEWDKATDEVRRLQLEMARRGM